jgi:hypothetical protein
VFLSSSLFLLSSSVDPKIPSHIALVSLMRNTIREEVTRGHFDVYISHTDQTLFKFSHLVSYLHESKLLPTHQPAQSLQPRIPQVRDLSSLTSLSPLCHHLHFSPLISHHLSSSLSFLSS